jgi:twitching motility protein PilT
VLSTLHTIDASKTVERIVGAFDPADQQPIRARLAASFRFFISQRFVRKKDGGRVAIFEILRSTLRTREYIERGEAENRSLLDAMRDGEHEGMQYFDGEIEKLVRSGSVSLASGLNSATNAGNLRILLADVPDEATAE